MLTSGKVNKHSAKLYFFQVKTLLHSQKITAIYSRNMLITFVDNSQNIPISEKVIPIDLWITEKSKD